MAADGSTVTAVEVMNVLFAILIGSFSLAMVAPEVQGEA